MGSYSVENPMTIDIFIKVLSRGIQASTNVYTYLDKFLISKDTFQIQKSPHKATK